MKTFSLTDLNASQFDVVLSLALLKALTQLRTYLTTIHRFAPNIDTYISSFYSGF